MGYSIGEEVRYILTGQFGIIKEFNIEDQLYTIDINGEEYVASEDELC